MQVKKIMVILLLTLYVANATGLSINFHYCCGHLAKITFLNLGHKKGCACNKTGASKKCCKDVVAHYQTDDHRNTPLPLATAFISFPVEPLIINCRALLFSPEFQSYTTIINVPERGSNPIFLLCNHFRI